MMKQYITDALVGVLNAAPARHPALAPLAPVKYPRRELQPELLHDASVRFRVSIRGYEYKHRGSRPKTPPEINVEQIRLVLNALLPGDLYVIAVEDHKTYIYVYVRRNLT